MSCQTGIEASEELRDFLGGCRGGCTRCVKVSCYIFFVGAGVGTFGGGVCTFDAGVGTFGAGKVLHLVEFW